MTPDLQRIVEALKACREDLVLVPIGGERYGVGSGRHGRPVFTGTRSECLAYIDARCAEAMVRAIREPSQAIVEAGWLKNICTSDQVWRAMCDAILGETQS